MTFVNELIPESEKEKFTFPVTTKHDGSKPTLWKWTIDRDRNAYLVFTKSVGGGYEGTPLTKFFVLNWNGKLIYLCAEPLGTSRKPAGVVMSWRIHKLDIPSDLPNTQEELMQIIREAFAMMGDLYDGEQYVAVNVDFDLSPSR